MFGLRHAKILKNNFLFLFIFIRTLCDEVYFSSRKVTLSDELFFVAQNWSRKTLSDDVLSSRKSLSREVTLRYELFFVAQNLVAQDFERRSFEFRRAK